MSESPNPNTIYDSERDLLLGIKRRCRHFIDTDPRGRLTTSTRGTKGLAGKASVAIKDKIGKLHRTEFFSWVFERNVASSTELNERELYGFVLWAFENPEPQPFTPEAGKWDLPPRFHSELLLIEKAFSGQYSFDLPLKSNREGTEAEIVRQLGFED